MALVPAPKNIFVEKFTKARTSWSFVIGIALAIGGYITWQYIPGVYHFDMPPANETKFGLLNLVLSIEATLSMPILWMGLELAAAKDREKVDILLKSTQELVETQAKLLAQLEHTTAQEADMIEDLQEDIHEIQEDVDYIRKHKATDFSVD